MSKLNYLKTGGIFLIPVVLTFAVFFSLSNGSEYYYKMKVINTSYGNHHQAMMFPIVTFVPTVSSISTVETKEWDKDNDNIPDYIDIDMGGDIEKSSVYGPITEEEAMENDLSNHPSNLYFPKRSDRFKGVTTYEVRDISGKVIVAESSNHAIDLVNHPSGVYFMTIKDATQTRTVSVFKKSVI